jgi:thioredoxin reductase (NADPH)
MAEPRLHDTAFPTLTPDQMEGFKSCPLCKRKRFRGGEALFRAGDRDPRFYVVIAGRIEIVDELGDAPKTVAVHGPGAFAGDVSLVSGRPAVVTAYARGDTDVYEVSPDALKQLLNHDPDLGDTILQAFIARRQLLREPGNFTGLRVVGSHSSQDTFRVRDFLSRNGQPFTWLDLDTDPTAKDLLRLFGLGPSDTPVVSCGRHVVLKNPKPRELAEALGLRRMPGPEVQDLVVVGAGPAGLAAAVYAASEGLRTVVLETMAPGGQAGRSMRIENYLGFAGGITGEKLIEQAVMQAGKFGACLPVGAQVRGLSFDGPLHAVRLDGGDTVKARCLVIATGAEYRVLGVPGCEEYEGRGVYYAATPIEAPVCRDQEVVVVGGGNSAGQAVVFLAQKAQARKVYVVVRGGDLRKSMSEYLVRRIEGIDNVEILTNTEVRRLEGDGSLEHVELLDRKSGGVKRLGCPALFSFIGANPRTDWLPPEIERDDKGFIKTGPSLASSPRWTARRPPFYLETTRPGVFAAGDVRSGSVKRCASAVGEGSMAVQFVHEHLKDI